MDETIQSLILKHYNSDKGAGKRKQLSILRVNKALGILMTVNGLTEKRKQYGCTVDDCFCPDHEHRGSICKHMIAERIWHRVYQDLQVMWLNEK